MNWKRGFRRITQVLAIIGAVVGFFVGGMTAADLWDEGPPPFIIAILSAPVAYCLIWLIYYFIRWLVLGFCDDQTESKEKDGEEQ